MKQKQRKARAKMPAPPPPPLATPPPPRWPALLLKGHRSKPAATLPLIVVILSAALYSFWRSGRGSSALTYHKDVAPIIHDRCATCHRPGEAAPFSLLTYADVSKHAKQIAEVTANRFMPPWLAEPGHGDFANSRRLTDAELSTIQRWVAEGAIEGNPANAPFLGSWTEGWQLGQPDLVVQSPEPYMLPAEGKDVYHNLVMPVTNATRRFVKAVEFRPGNAKVVHHASIFIDQTQRSRRLAKKQSPPGFDGMELPDSAAMVAGQMLGWEPGKRPEPTEPGLAWPLEKNSDLVVQLHLHPSGKAEAVRPVIGFYFTDQPPTNTPFLLRLPQWRIDIPAGETNYVVENSCTLPVDVELLRISPHAHYLAKEMQGYALLPDGRKESLLLIKEWNFNWQGDYRYAKPVFLPRGTKLVLHFTYDNSATNIRNPHNPPVRVRHGPQTTDEMAQLTFQVLAHTPEDRRALVMDNLRSMTLEAVAYNQSLLQENPTNSAAHAKVGQALLPLGRFAEAEQHLQTAVRLDPSDDKAFYDLALVHLSANRLAEAKSALETVLRLNPDDFQANGNLGLIYQREGNLELAATHFAEALRLNPDDAAAGRALAALRSVRRQDPQF